MPVSRRLKRRSQFSPLMAGVLVAAFVVAGFAIDLTIRAAVAAPPAVPTKLRAFVGGDSIAVLWNRGNATAVKNYELYRDGVKVATVPPGVNVNTTTTRYYDKSVTPGATYRYQVRAVGTTGGSSALTGQLSVQHPTNPLPVPTVTIDVSAAPDLQGWANNAVALIKTWYPKFGHKLAYPDYAPRTSLGFRIVKNTGYAAYASGNTITIDEAFARNGTNQMAAILHEMTHIVQNYPPQPGLTNTVIEGLATWTPDALYNDYDRPAPPAGKLYTEGYGAAAYFFSWVMNKYQAPQLVHELNVAASKGAYSDDIFRKVTGKSIGALWTEMTGRRVTSQVLVKGLGDRCLDLAGSNTTNGSTLWLWDCNGNWGQLFLFVANPNESGSGTLQVGRKCVDISAYGKTDGTKIQLWDCHGKWNQEWVPRANGTFFNPGSGKCVAVKGGANVLGAPMELRTCNPASAAQQWRPQGWDDIHGHQVSATGPVKLAANGQCMARSAGGTANGTRIIQWTCVNGAADQQWAFLAAPGSTTVGTVRSAGKCLDIKSYGKTNGSILHLWTCHGQWNQEWVKRADGTLFNPGSGKCVRPKGGSMTRGTSMEIWTCSTATNQRWSYPAP